VNTKLIKFYIKGKAVVLEITDTEVVVVSPRAEVEVSDENGVGTFQGNTVVTFK
jgi:hypothetical protein